MDYTDRKETLAIEASRLGKQLISLILACEPQWEAKKIDMTVDVDIVEFTADTGQGINEQDQQRIFERFYKADQSWARTAGGSGLGLSIAYKITEMHTGSISVPSKVGEGTVFTVMLPLRQKVMKGSSNSEMYTGTVS